MTDRYVAERTGTTIKRMQWVVIDHWDEEPSRYYGAESDANDAARDLNLKHMAAEAAKEAEREAVRRRRLEHEDRVAKLEAAKKAKLNEPIPEVTMF